MVFPWFSYGSPMVFLGVAGPPADQTPSHFCRSQSPDLRGGCGHRGKRRGTWTRRVQFGSEVLDIADSLHGHSWLWLQVSQLRLNLNGLIIILHTPYSNHYNHRAMLELELDVTGHIPAFFMSVKKVCTENVSSCWALENYNSTRQILYGNVTYLQHLTTIGLKVRTQSGGEGDSKSDYTWITQAYCL